MKHRNKGTRPYQTKRAKQSDKGIGSNNNDVKVFNTIPDTVPGCFGEEYDSFFVSRCHVCIFRLPCARQTIGSE